jgi:hypothetical protein
MFAMIQCGGGYKDQVHALERNLTPYTPSPAHRPAVTLMVKKTATRWRGIPLNILMITLKIPRCSRNKMPHSCAHTSPQMALLNPVLALKSYHIQIYFNNIFSTYAFIAKYASSFQFPQLNMPLPSRFLN